MKKLSLPSRWQTLLGLRVPRSRRRLYWGLRIGSFMLLLLPWAFVLMGLMESWNTYAIGDDIQIPIWVWVAVVAIPAVAWLLSRILAGRIALQVYVRKMGGRNL